MVHYFLFEAFYLASAAGFSLGFSMRMEGRRHVPKKGAALLIANHQSFMDPFIVGVAARRRLVYLARKTLLRNPVMRWVMLGQNSVPIDQDGIGIEGLRVVLKQLENGEAALVFPEGSRTPDGRLHPLRPGIHLLIQKAKVPVVPIGIAGAYHAWPCWRALPIPSPLFLPATDRTIGVAIGPAIEPGELLDLSREKLLTKLHERLAQMHAQADEIRRRP
jgi:1-acyl-sn-glycerol-3-phosphate acyltransferase